VFTDTTTTDFSSPATVSVNCDTSVAPAANDGEFLLTYSVSNDKTTNDVSCKTTLLTVGTTPGYAEGISVDCSAPTTEASKHVTVPAVCCTK
jgi:hypothetical protein